MCDELKEFKSAIASVEGAKSSPLAKKITVDAAKLNDIVIGLKEEFAEASMTGNDRNLIKLAIQKISRVVESADRIVSTVDDAIELFDKVSDKKLWGKYIKDVKKYVKA
jgi:hypothetical protein